MSESFSFTASSRIFHPHSDWLCSHTGCKIVTNSNEGGTPVNKSMLAGIGIGVAAALGVAAVVIRHEINEGGSVR
ncbi:hypothetical protein EHB12_15435 [Salmonella enterica subsp. enterica serovar Montevideo]|nr:hypothetical protein [Salmonella enterica subsp. enterica serovar Montevideo]